MTTNGTRGRRRPFAAAAPLVGVAAAAGLATLAWGTLVERRWYALRHHTVPALRAADAPALRILHLSDLHLLPRHEELRAFLRRCRDAGPDLVVATGDLVGDAGLLERSVDLLDLARGDRPGVVVLGSNDLYGPRPGNPLRYLVAPSAAHGGQLDRALDTGHLVRLLAAHGWEVADNRRLRVRTRAGLVDVAGLGDPHIGRDRPERVDWSGRDGVSGGEPAVLRLGVVHAPYLRALDRFDAEAFDLALAGHTHGGQVRVPGVGALVANCDLPLGQSRGLSRHGAALWLHVSAGLGHSAYAPYRVACRPEATVLDVVGARAH